MQQILVTGGAGYIGSHAVLALRAAGHSVVVLDDLSTGYREAVPADIPFYQGSVSDIALVARILQLHSVHTVIHFAAALIIPESVENPLKYWGNNVGGTTALLAACAAADVRQFVFSSTAAVYGVPVSTPIPEGEMLAPINPYGHSKATAESVLRDTGLAHGMRSVVLRYFNVAGADPELRTGQRSRQATHLIKVACQAVVGKRDGVQIFGNDYDTPDGTCIRDYIHVSDLAEAHVAAAAYLMEGGSSTVLNCGYGRGYSVREVLNGVERVAGRDLRIKVAPRRAGDPPRLIADVSRIQATLRWRPRFDDIDFIIQTALAWEEALASGLSNMSPLPRDEVFSLPAAAA
ncbi:UDP-glucose 4-epimerase GalE (plasmid) [Roseomonas sp. FDAARGOS_362]|uniref:UDP-glucose 4-epimerase GalE n=1 Tax=Roseomonas sp. FDAARGOS_362 TaxID=2018065 RepID=UPI000C1913C0|nr:UDP-glucose 4-epimerase GalE [Roseomonas sp. FDAARGOS_362]ATR19516.1 UDP-glucose 4-epimerase GalE [Roseomonas sp. FDAARGOS_362]